MATGSSPGIVLSKQQSMLSPTGNASYVHMASTSPNYSQLYHTPPTAESYSLIKPAVFESDNAKTANSQTPPLSMISTSCGSKTPQATALQTRSEPQQPLLTKRRKLAAAGTTTDAPTPARSARMGTSAQNADQCHTKAPTAQRPRKNDQFARWESRPKFSRNLIWDNELTARPCSALATETAEPLPDPPIFSPAMKIALKTITDHPSLFKIVTPIKVDVFEKHLAKHPNQPFVRSVCKGLREGFWPWADISNPELPITWDNSSLYPLDPNHEATVANDIRNELDAERYSAAFGPDLLPGMFSMPLFVIPKPHSVKFRVVIDQSAEPHSLNSLIPANKVSVRLDNMHDLGAALNRATKEHEGIPLTLIKSDVSTAYRLMPMHPLWQIRQVVTFKGMRHVDRCNIWGGRAAGHIFCSFMGLVLWIAIKVKNIQDMFAYVDDAFSWDFEGNLDLYEPYESFIPEKQFQLLSLWDELGIPHEQSKQVQGQSLRIIGFEVDVSQMTITMPPKALHELIEGTRTFAKPNH